MGFWVLGVWGFWGLGFRVFGVRVQGLVSRGLSNLRFDPGSLEDDDDSEPGAEAGQVRAERAVLGFGKITGSVPLWSLDIYTAITSEALF